MGPMPAHRTAAEPVLVRSPVVWLIPGAAEIDLPAAERAVADLLVALGQDVGDEHTSETSRRVAATFAELLSPRPFSATTLLAGVRP